MPRRSLRFQLASLCLVLAGPALAEPAADDAANDQRPRVVWDDAWPRFRPSEAIVSAAMLLPIAGALFLYPHPGANIRGGFLFDDAVRDALVLDSRSARTRAACAPPRRAAAATPTTPRSAATPTPFTRAS